MSAKRKRIDALREMYARDMVSGRSDYLDRATRPVAQSPTLAQETKP